MINETTDTINTTNNKSKVWFITGATSGTGLALAEALINKGDKVVGTSRDFNKWSNISISKHRNFLPIQLDMLNEQQVNEAIENTIKHFGDLNVLVNNAGCGLVGAVEETSDKEARYLMDSLYFGPLNLIRAVLPHFRTNKSGYIINVSSIVGIKGHPRFGIYSASKFALTGLSEALYEDVKPLGIRVSCVIIGNFKTGFKESNQIVENPIQVYDTKKFWNNVLESTKSSFVPGDVKKFANIIIEAEQLENPPYNIVIGEVSFHITQKKINDLQSQVDSQIVRNSDVKLDD